MPADARRRWRKPLLIVLVAVNAFIALVWLLRPPTMEDRARDLRAEKLEPRYERLKALETPWQDSAPRTVLHRGEAPGATFAEYVSWNPPRPAAGRSAVDLQPLGDFSPARRRLLQLTADFLHRLSGLEIRLHDPLPLPPVPHRTHEGKSQVLVGALHDALHPPAGSLGLLAVLSDGLYPGDKWNYIFYDGAEGVMTGSLQEFGDPDASPEAFRLALSRTLKIETQQLLALLAVPRCVAYECLNNPSDGMDDLDRQPLHLCPACLQKLCWNTGCDPARALGATAEFLRDNGLADRWYDEAGSLLAAH